MTTRLALVATAWLTLVAGSSLAQPPAVHLDRSGQLTTQSPRDPANAKAFADIVEVPLQADRVYRIDLLSNDFETMLRLETKTGMPIAVDEGSGAGGSRLILAVPRNDAYRLVATSPVPNAVGKYRLIVKDPTVNDLFILRSRRFPRMDNDARVKLLDDVLAHLDARGKTITNEDADLVFELVYMLENSRMRGVGDWCLKFSRALAVSDAERMKGLSKMVEGVSRRLRLVGNPMALTGTTLDGKKFDWNAYRGKVVLVDFWATWCGPCVAEMPTLKKLHAAYKDKGFDIVGVSLDHDDDAPADFFKRREIPWSCIFEKGARHQPLADYYGVSAIPLAILVDRQGRVISTDARGPELERLLEEHLGAAGK